ncbi:hypothetical protein AB1Y20_019122 [Prymnesium parvum]|uniref:Calmodulin-lysine N-methyltransferase n=1 Tax=Prymnesium parvum TaxID=97485 RepID=A0AB34JUV9_PRYPA
MAGGAEEPLRELRLRVDALFESASGRVGQSHEEMATFVARLSATAAALLRERFPEECGVIHPQPKRQRHASIVCSGSWETTWESVEALERARGDEAYEDVELQLREGQRALRIRQFTAHFWCSGCRLWDSAVALGRHILEHPELVRSRRVIELGCGVAPIPGLCAAASAAASVWLTDGEANLLPSVRHNLARGRETFAEFAAHVQVGLLQWGVDPALLTSEYGQHDVLLGSDLIYSSGASEPLAAAANALVQEGGSLMLVYPSGRHGVSQFASALVSSGWSVEEHHISHELLRGCANQGCPGNYGAPCVVRSSTKPTVVHNALGKPVPPNVLRILIKARSSKEVAAATIPASTNTCTSNFAGNYWHGTEQVAESNMLHADIPKASR